MAGQSDQEKAFHQLMADSKRLGRDISGMNVEAKNIFEGYNPVYSGSTQIKNLNDSYNMKKKSASNKFGRTASKVGSDTGAMVASQGLTGSLALDAVNKAKKNVLDGEFDFLKDLDIAHNQQKLGVMDKANAFDLKRAFGEQSVISQNVNNKMNQKRMLTDLISQQGGLASGYDDTTWLDDAFEGMNAVARLISSAKNPGGA